MSHSDVNASHSAPIKNKVQYPQYSVLEESSIALKPVRDLVLNEGSWQTYKAKTVFGKAWSFISYLFPILIWIQSYSLPHFVSDIIAGVTISCLAVPQDLGYAKLANVPAVNGLYASFVPPLVYTVMGSSRHVAMGTVSVVSIILGTLLSGYYSPTIDNPMGSIDKSTGRIAQITNPDYYNLALTTTFFVGIIQTGMGVFRLGFIIDFFSHAAVVGFMAGAAITIGGSQMKSFLGYVDFSTEFKIQETIKSIASHPHEFQWRAFVIGISFLTYLLTVKILSRLNKKNVYLFYLNVTGPILAVIVGTLAVYLSKVDTKYNLSVIGDIKKGINPSSLHNLRLSGKDAVNALKVAVVAGLVSLTETVAIGRTFAALGGYRIDGNKEMTAVGLGNLFGSFSSCIVSTGSFSRSSVNYEAGAKSAMSNAVMAVTVMFILLFITPLFYHLPRAVVAAIIMAAVAPLVNIPAAYQVWKSDKFDFVVLLGAFFGVIFISIEIGLLIAICISAAKVFVNVSRPPIATLGKIPGSLVYQSVRQYSHAELADAVLVLRVDCNIFFANANFIREKIERMADNYYQVYSSEHSLQFVVLELTSVFDIDTTGLHCLRELCDSLKAKAITLCLCGMSEVVLFKLTTCGLQEIIGLEWIFVSAHEAVMATSQVVQKSLI